MKYDFRDHETLARYLAMLRDVLVDLRFRATGQDPGAVELLDAVHNVPDLLTRWPDMKEEWVIGHLEAYEQKYLGGHGRYSGVLKQGPREGWQLKWQSGKSSWGGRALSNSEMQLTRSARA